MPILNKKSVIHLVAVAVAVLLHGCSAQSVKLTEQDRAEPKQLKSIKVVHQHAVWPTFKTPMGVLVSKLTFGISEDLSAGQKLVRKFKITDPSQKVKEKFLMQINKGPKVAIFNSDNQPLSYEQTSIEMMRVKYKKGLVLKFHSYWWEIWYYPTNFSRYQMWFQTNAELVRLDNLKVLWKGRCRADQKDAKTAPTLDELTAASSKVLQRWVDDATTQCSEQLVKDFLAHFKDE